MGQSVPLENNDNQKGQAMIDINEVEKKAREELAKEKFDSVKDKLISKLKELDSAKKVVRNIETEIEQIKASAGS